MKYLAGKLLVATAAAIVLAVSASAQIGVPQSYPVGTGPIALAFDGTNIWVTDAGGNVTKLLAATGATVGTYPAGSGPEGIVFDGTNIWVANVGSNTVTKLLAATGATLGTYPAGAYPTALAFDGTNIWVTNRINNTVTKLLAATGATVGTYTVGAYPTGIAFDGTNIWVANCFSNTVTKLLAATGATVGTYPAEVGPGGIAFDGTNIWVSNQYGNSVTELLAATGATVGTYPGGPNPVGIAFDGTNIWATNGPSIVFDGTNIWLIGLGDLTELLAATGAPEGTYTAPTGGNTVTKIPVSAKQVMVGGVGSSSQFQSASLAAFQLAGGTAGNAGHWTFGNGGGIIDSRDAAIIPEVGNLAVVWNAAQTQVWFYLSVDSVAGDRAYFAQPRATLAVLRPALTAGQNEISINLWGEDSPLPSAVLALINGAPFNAAFTDILPADAKFAMNRVNCGTGTTATIPCLGYGTSDPNLGAPIQSAFSTSVVNTVNFNVYGNDPITGDEIPNYTVVPVGIAPIIFLANRTDANGLGQPGLFNDITYQATAQLLFTGTDCDGTAFGGFTSNYYFPINPILREPLSGAMNTFEYNIMVQNLQGNVTDGYFSQESVFNPPYSVPGSFGAIQPATNNPLNGACPGGSGYAAGPQGKRMRAVNTAEMVSAVEATADSIGYIFFSYGNVSSIANNPDYGYLTYQTVDPINPSGSYTTPFQSELLTYPGNGLLPTCTVPYCWITPGASFPNVRTGAYKAWSLLRAVADTGSAALTNLQALATAEQNQLNGTQPDFLPFNATPDGDPGFIGYRSHFVPGMNGTPTFNFNATNTPNNGITVPANEAGGDVGGCLDYKYDPNLLNCRY